MEFSSDCDMRSRVVTSTNENLHHTIEKLEHECLLDCLLWDHQSDVFQSHVDTLTMSKCSGNVCREVVTYFFLASSVQDIKSSCTLLMTDKILADSLVAEIFYAA